MSFERTVVYGRKMQQFLNAASWNSEGQLHFQHDSRALVLLHLHHQVFSEVFDTEIFIKCI